MSILSIAIAHIRTLAMTCTAAGCLPLPVLLTTDPNHNAVISCLYLGLASSWLATEMFRVGELPGTRSAWCGKMLAVSIAVAANVALFIALGVTVGVHSSFPFPAMAVLSVIPAVGLAPGMLLLVRQQYSAIILGALLLLAAKLAGCVAARIVYGPDFAALGYIAGDWRTAKLMITAFWILTASASLGAIVAGYYRCRPELDRPFPSAPGSCS